MRNQPGESSYAEDFKERSTSNMQQVPRVESYRDFNFICFDKGVESLSDYLGPVKEYRGPIRINDIGRVRQRACECDEDISSHYRRIMKTN